LIHVSHVACLKVGVRGSNTRWQMSKHVLLQVSASQASALEVNANADRKLSQCVLGLIGVAMFIRAY